MQTRTSTRIHPLYSFHAFALLLSASVARSWLVSMKSQRYASTSSGTPPFSLSASAGGLSPSLSEICEFCRYRHIDSCIETSRSHRSLVFPDGWVGQCPPWPTAQRDLVE